MFYIGYVIRMVKKQLHCSNCLEVLCSNEMSTPATTVNDVGDLFIAQKNRGGLLKPSKGVVQICQETERRFQRMMIVTNGKIPQSTCLKLAITTSVLSDVCSDGRTPFPELEEHMYETAADNNHVYSLVKCIAECYCKIKFHHLAKQFNDGMAPEKIRKQCSKLILFKNQ